jgi:ligand-binding SRPBCC domain-containing protein
VFVGLGSAPVAARSSCAARRRWQAEIVTVTFETRTSIAAPPSVVFDLAISIDTHLASQASADERAVGGVTTGQIGLGEEVTWRATHFHVPFTMTSRITALERPHRFVDEQTRGPFRRFRHEHEFPPSEIGTTMIDRISFDAPLGPIGRVVELAVLGSYLERLIVERGEFLKVAAERQHRSRA